MNKDALIDVATLYADTYPYLQVLTLSLLHRDWCTLVKQPFFRDLVQFCANLEIEGSKEILDMVISY